MSLRRVLLIVLLTTLALCAAVGTLALLTTHTEDVWKLLGTAIDTAVATGLLLPLSFVIDRPKFRAGGLTAMVTVILCWLCFLALLWNPLRNPVEERLAVVLGTTVLCGFPASIALGLITFRWARVAAWMVVGLAGMAFLGGLAAAIVPEGIYTRYSGDLTGEIWGTAMVPYGVGAICALLLVNLGQGDRRYFRWAAVTCGLLAMAIGEAAVWGKADDEIWGRLFGMSLALCMVGAHVNLVLMARLRAAQGWLMWATIGCSLAAGATVCAGLASADLSGPAEWPLFFRGSAAASIAAGCGSLALIVLSAFNRRVDTPPVTFTPMERIKLVCPRCGANQELAIGEAVCSACELQISIKVTEPRCPGCGYLLYRLTSARCPECGAVVRPGAPDVPSPQHAFPVGQAAGTEPVKG